MGYGQTLNPRSYSGHPAHAYVLMGCAKHALLREMELHYRRGAVTLLVQMVVSFEVAQPTESR